MQLYSQLLYVCFCSTKVPFGNHAFMPGHLKHTNEILVLLGDNWFALRSAKQSVDIVQRRIVGMSLHGLTIFTAAFRLH